MAYMKVYNDNYVSLVNVLPMNDVLFTANLTGEKLLPANIGSHIGSLPTRAKKAEYFLQNVIQPSLAVNDTRDLNNFISIMKESEYRALNTVAAKMIEELEGILSICCQLC